MLKLSQSYSSSPLSTKLHPTFATGLFVALWPHSFAAQAQPVDAPAVYSGCYLGEVVPTPQRAQYFDRFLPLFDVKQGKAVARIAIGDDAGPLTNRAMQELSAQVMYLAKNEAARLPIASPADSRSFPTVILLGTATNGLFTSSALKGPAAEASRLRLEGYVIRSVREGTRRLLLAIGKDDLGCYYAVQSLLQLMTVRDGEVVLREANITDWPDFAIRAHQYDGGFPDERQARFSLTWMPKLKLNQLGFGQAYDVPPEWRTLDAEGEKRSRFLCELGKRLGTVDVLFYPHPHRSDPKLNIRISDPEDVAAMVALCKSVMTMGAKGIMLRSDDIYPLAPEDKEKFGDHAASHVHLINEIHRGLKPEYPSFKFLFCSPYYIGNWVKRDSTAQAYLRKLGEGLPKDVLVIWTGPVTRSLEILPEDLSYFTQAVGRTPFLWDNTVYAHRSRYGYDAGHPSYFLDTFETKYPKTFAEDTLGITYNWSISSPLSLVGGVCTADYLWNTDAYDPGKSLRKALAMVAGPKAVEPLLRFREAYYEVFDSETSGRLVANFEKVMGAERTMRAAFDEVKAACESADSQTRGRDIARDFVAELQNSLNSATTQIARARMTIEPLMAARAKALTQFDFTGWKFSKEGQWTGKSESGIAEISFPWGTRSKAGACGAFATEVPVPASPTGKHYLVFSVSDDYMETGTPPHAWPGYLFKQVLVDARVVWEDDVEGTEPVEFQTLQVVDISDCVAGKGKVTVAFRGMDKRGVGNMGAKIQFSNACLAPGPFTLKQVLVNVPGSPALSPKNQLSVTVQFTTASLGRRQSLYGKGSPLQYFGYIHEGGAVTAGLFSSGKEISLGSRSRLKANQRHHFAFTYDGAAMKLYLDGKLESAMPSQGEVDVNTGNLEIGCYPGAAQAFDGRVEELKIFNRALSDAEVATEASALKGEAPVQTQTERSVSADIAVNGSAEEIDADAKPTGWACKDPDGEWGATSPGHAGKRCAFILVKKGVSATRTCSLLQGRTKDAPLAYQAQPNTVCRFAFWAKGDVARIAVNGLFARTDGSAISPVASSLGTVWLTKEWKRYEGTILAPEDAARMALEFQILDPEAGAGGTLYVDEVEAHPLPAGLVGWWRPLETGATVATDYSGSGNDGALWRRWAAE